MAITRAFKYGDAFAVCIPAALAYEDTDIELEIERIGDELRIRPARRSLAGVVQKFASFSPDGLPYERDDQEQADRQAPS
ncbi:AbrB family transcriptional regulator [Cupriavidus gilardii]|jgi:antitoxin VapB|uniref:Virulence-associated protein n=3 Tax=Cupriavidus TaxID=106589 RepID=A0A976AAH2_9BURK|nr:MULTISPECIES: AbrB family transcriptional regulator [Cupriavidus]SOY73062.1 Virulence-associated protein [Cupriavidus taiwanensis]KAA6117625.1 AbrB family transcriptional regulator [Cupriavidus cauae]MBO4120647.1 AbrB family transcriptional regulator [Cupriavidus gilardii]MCA7082512.1 AbrB family transcriptional regulator [Cupriavidus sp. DB3]MCT9074809.1 AbrB family transcriptional regulator [Cupriavidus gilardii]